MATNDRIMDDMVAQDQPLVPRVDKYKDTKRAGMRDDDLPVFRNEGDAAMFLEAAGYVSPPAEILRGVMMMKQGDVGSGLATAGFGAIGGGTIRAAGKGSLKAIQALGNMFRKAKPGVLDDIIIAPGRTQMTRPTYHQQQVRAKAGREELTRRGKESGKHMDTEHVEGLIHAENVKATRAAQRTGTKGVLKGQGEPSWIVGGQKRGMNERQIVKKTGELKSAIFKAEEYIQRHPMGLEPFMREAKIIAGKRANPTKVTKVAEDVRRNYLITVKAVEDKALTGREMLMYRNSAFPDYHQEAGEYAGLGGVRLVNEIKNKVRQSLHAEDLAKSGIGVEITPKGVRATPAHPIDYLK